MSVSKVKVLFYHSHFFNNSETFIYQQAINPHIDVVLLAKKFSDSGNMNSNSFTKLQYKRSWWDGLASNLLKLFSIDRYYQSKSVRILADLIASHKVEMIHAQFGFSAIRILPVAKKLNLPLVVSFHGIDASRMLRQRSYRNGLKDVFNYASRIIVCDPGMAEVLPITPEQKNKLSWVPYGINLKLFSSQPKKKNPILRILHVGRFVDKKGVPDLIRAFSAINSMYPIQLDLVGTGPEEKLCRTIVHENKLTENVVFHKWKSHEEVKLLMQQCDVFVLNSRTAQNGDKEGLPVGMLEAMAMRLPVVSTYHAAIPLAVDQDVTGILVKERDTKALSKALASLIEKEQLQQTMGMAGRAKIESLFTMEQMHIKLLQVYQGIQKT
jgi:colanic acid/amylovoran biosynthesis glycosyltransferase